MSGGEKDVALVVVLLVGIPVVYLLARLGDAWARRLRAGGRSGWLIDAQKNPRYYETIAAGHRREDESELPQSRDDEPSI